jgi:hypothetical protein
MKSSFSYSQYIIPLTPFKKGDVMSHFKSFVNSCKLLPLEKGAGGIQNNQANRL